MYPGSSGGAARLSQTSHTTRDFQGLNTPSPLRQAVWSMAFKLKVVLNWLRCLNTHDLVGHIRQTARHQASLGTHHIAVKQQARYAPSGRCAGSLRFKST